MQMIGPNFSTITTKYFSIIRDSTCEMPVRNFSVEHYFIYVSLQLNFLVFSPYQYCPAYRVYDLIITTHGQRIFSSHHREKFPDSSIGLNTGLSCIFEFGNYKKFEKRFLVGLAEG